MAEYERDANVPCPKCRGYNLERQWCHICQGTGQVRSGIKERVPRLPVYEGRAAPTADHQEGRGDDH